ncbi:hypothetical protein LTR17_004853 [Elasticomyces elasticus]|nr:hypothetical protein LTR17_004853 [Elasticomyces elasticus]
MANRKDMRREDLSGWTVCTLIDGAKMADTNAQLCLTRSPKRRRMHRLISKPVAKMLIDRRNDGEHPADGRNLHSE